MSTNVDIRHVGNLPCHAAGSENVCHLFLNAVCKWCAMGHGLAQTFASTFSGDSLYSYSLSYDRAGRIVSSVRMTPIHPVPPHQREASVDE